MTDEQLEAGILLKKVIDHYSVVLTDLGDDAKKEKALYALLSSGNAVLADTDAAYITTLRDDFIASAIVSITTRLELKADEFEALGNPA